MGEVEEIVAVEGLAHRVRRIPEARLEPLDRPATAFDVRVVRVEQHHFRTGRRSLVSSPRVVPPHEPASRAMTRRWRDRKAMRVSDDDIERCAQFMAHIGKKLAFSSIGFLSS